MDTRVSFSSHLDEAVAVLIGYAINFSALRKGPLNL